MAKTKSNGSESAAGTQKIKIQELIFTAQAPYNEGHVLTALEAKALNQLRGENLRNNFAKQVKDLKAACAADPAGAREPTPEELSLLHGKFADYDSRYTFSERKAAAPVDPVEREATKLAADAVRTALRKKNIDVKTLAEGKFDELVSGLLAKDSRFTEEAKRRVEATRNVAIDVLDGLEAASA